MSRERKKQLHPQVMQLENREAPTDWRGPIADVLKTRSLHSGLDNAQVRPTSPSLQIVDQEEPEPTRPVVLDALPPRRNHEAARETPVAPEQTQQLSDLFANPFVDVLGSPFPQPQPPAHVGGFGRADETPRGGGGGSGDGGAGPLSRHRRWPRQRLGQLRHRRARPGPLPGRRLRRFAAAGHRSCAGLRDQCAGLRPQCLQGNRKGVRTLFC